MRFTGLALGLVLGLVMTVNSPLARGAEDMAAKTDALISKKAVAKDVELTVTMKRRNVAGEPIYLIVAMANTGKDAARYAGASFWEDFQLQVVDPHWRRPKPIPLTRFGEQYAWKESPAQLSYVVEDLMPGGTFTAVINISVLFDLTMPGKYRATVKRVINPLTKAQFELEVTDLDFEVLRPLEMYSRIEPKATAGQSAASAGGAPGAQQDTHGSAPDDGKSASKVTDEQAYEWPAIEARVRAGETPEEMRDALARKVKVRYENADVTDATMFLEATTRLTYVICVPDLPENRERMTFGFDGQLARVLDLICFKSGTAWKAEGGKITIASLERLKHGPPPRVGDIPAKMREDMKLTVSVNLADADLAEVLRLLKIITPFKYEVDLTACTKKVSISLHGTIESILDDICRTTGLAWKAEDGVIRIGVPGALREPAGKDEKASQKPTQGKTP